MRNAAWEDRKVLFDWANDPSTRRNAFGSSLIEWDGHLEWLRARLDDAQSTRIFLAGRAGVLVGQIRFDRTGDEAEVDYCIDPAHRGGGLGCRLLQSGCRRIAASWPEIKRVVGWVKPDNIASIRSFERSGFREDGSHGARRRFTWATDDRRFVIAASRRWYEGMVERLGARIRGSFVLIRSPHELISESLWTPPPTYVFFPHWSWIIPASVHSQHDCVVFHMTDLPFGRGGSPLQNLISRGISETQVSAILADATLDAGDVLLKRPLSLHGAAEEIYLRAADVIETMIHDIIREDPDGEPQQGEAVAFKRRTPEQSSIAGIQTLDQLFDHIRMLDAEGYPHAFLDIGPLTLRFTRAARRHGEIVADCSITLRDSG